ncbi:Cof-type HAD-IIB family hydrolase [Clostridium estertheticum]|uniref:Cof-type HAD-IIB family hydrolase n=1 Tax=Clostridium estertheticum TaxID=238834 RepID=UPI001C6E1593|nr:Cof-type HAD-IIB family hydrolase [Clostridium estertheticum]MBW9173749.1 Cof-type HAD-IIB family hydrolase [Clostridium estertheticum]WLC74923.1 Cof-type HAD-IIB family hydrolase [Clostridium estertheticum]
MKKVIFFDIDGTLIDCTRGITKITKEVEKSIRKLQTEGNYIFIATGRPYAFISEELLKFGFDGFVFTNGAQVVVREELIYKQEIKKDVVKTIVNNFEKFNIEYILEGEKYSYMKSECEDLYAYYDNFHISRKYIKSEYNISDINIYKLEMLCKSKEAEKYCLSLQGDEFDCNHNISSNIFEVYSSRETKASGIMRVLNHLNIPVENSYAFGDGINDIEMLESVGCGIAMGNASEKVKSHAKKVTCDVINDGIAVGIEKFIN